MTIGSLCLRNNLLRKCGNGFLAALFACGGSASHAADLHQCPDSQIERNKELIRILSSADQNTPEGVAEVAAIMAPDYIQHNPLILDHQGREGYIQAVERLVNMGISPNYEKPELVIANCDHVAAMLKFVREDPEHPGQTYDSFWFDIWRVEDGLLAEHWDQAIKGLDYEWDKVLK